MPNLQNLLAILGHDQKLAPGYLTPSGTPATAGATLVALKQQFDPWVRAQNPLPGMTGQSAPNILFTPAWVKQVAIGQAGIFLEGIDGQLDLTHGQNPAYLFTS